MKALRLILTLVTTSLMFPGIGSCERSQFKHLSEIGTVVENLGKDEEDLGLSRESLESKVLVSLKRDIPKLRISKAANSYIYLQMTCITAIRDFYSCDIQVELNRPVLITEDWSNTIVGTDMAAV